MWARMAGIYWSFWRRLFWRYGWLGYALMAPVEPMPRVVAIRRKGHGHARLHLV
jgi:hypothetical protein